MNNQNNNTSLKKSHSKVSNFKLTLLSLITIIAFSALWIGIALLKYEGFPFSIALILTIAGGVLSLLGLIGFNAFKR